MASTQLTILFCQLWSNFQLCDLGRVWLIFVKSLQTIRSQRHQKQIKCPETYSWREIKINAPKQTGKRPAQKRTILHELVVKLPYFLFLFYGFIFPLGFWSLFCSDILFRFLVSCSDILFTLSCFMFCFWYWPLDLFFQFCVIWRM